MAQQPAGTQYIHRPACADVHLVHTVHQAQDCTMYSYEVDHIIITENDKTVVKQQHMSCPKTYYDSILKSCCLHISMNNDPKTSIDLLI